MHLHRFNHNVNSNKSSIFSSTHSSSDSFIVAVVTKSSVQKTHSQRGLSFFLQLLSCVRLFATPWTAGCQASLSFSIYQSLLKLMAVEPGMRSSRLILCHSLLLLCSVFPSIRVFSNELALRMRWPKYWNFSFSITLSN